LIGAAVSGLAAVLLAIAVHQTWFQMQLPPRFFGRLGSIPLSGNVVLSTIAQGVFSGIEGLVFAVLVLGRSRSRFSVDNRPRSARIFALEVAGAPVCSRSAWSATTSSSRPTRTRT
jgi:hypothetical protein